MASPNQFDADAIVVSALSYSVLLMNARISHPDPFDGNWFDLTLEKGC
jgi:hypothetical protein